MPKTGRLLIFILAIGICCFPVLVLAQAGQGSLQGIVMDGEFDEPLPFANIVLEQNGNQVTGTSTDFDGKYTLKPIPPGKYTLKAFYVGYQTIVVNDIVIKAEKITFYDMTMQAMAVNMDEVFIISYKVPLIDKDNTSTGATITAEDIQKIPGRDPVQVAQTVAGVYSQDDGSNSINVKGARDNSNDIYVDGVKVIGGTNIPKDGIEQVSVITGGVPAQYGDVTGGIISITTKGPASEYGGGVEYSTSGYRLGDNVYGLDKFGFNLLDFSVSGPLLVEKDSLGNKEQPKLGFLLGGSMRHEVDPLPSSLGIWQVKDEVLQDLINDPLRIDPSSGGTYLNHAFITVDDIENVATHQNNALKRIALNGKIDYALNKQSNLTLGGFYGLNQGNGMFPGSGLNRTLYAYTFFNPGRMPEYKNEDYRGFARYTYRFNQIDPTIPVQEQPKKFLSNAFISVQAEYSKSKDLVQDDRHKDDFFSYGHIGTFKTYQQRDYGAYEVEEDSASGISGYLQQTFEDTLITFLAGTANPEAAAYTEAYYRLFGWEGFDANGNPVYDEGVAGENLRNFNNIQQNGGLLNGDIAPSVNQLWVNPAAGWNSYQKQERDQFRLTLTGSADVKDHAISCGIEVQKQIDRSYSLSPTGLWNLGRLLTNNHIENLDKSDPTIDSLGTYPIISYERLNSSPGEYDGNSATETQSFFDYNARKALGLDPDGTDYVDFDAYGPEVYDVSFFSAAELLNNGNSYVSYMGYDHTGEKVSTSKAFDSFFNDRDEYGNQQLTVAPFQPIYMAAYVQDKFSYQDLIFNVGLRVDRYDANQKVLKDEYVFFPTVSAGEGEALDLREGALPSNIGDNFVAYVDNVQNPTRIVGYRDGSVWYDKDGIELEDGSSLNTSTGIAPLLRDKTGSGGLMKDAYEDYEAQLNMMPRISFSFNPNDDFFFFAHYDVLTRMPSAVNSFNPVDYSFIEQIASARGVINNPNLRPEKTIDYEIGFQRKISNNSSLKMSSFYREFRDMIQIVNVVNAYPANYITYGNIDFGTVKGLSLAYDMRATKNIRLWTNYTLQFAEGTGSSNNSGLNLARAGAANLRTLSRLSFDQRHTITGAVSVFFAEGDDYNGPVMKDKPVLENTSATFTYNVGSGSPYSAQSNITPEAISSGQSVLEGSINGSNLPWTFTVNMHVEKLYPVKLKMKNEEGEAIDKIYPLTVYFDILNLLDRRNIINVYRATGNPDDDGYLEAAQYQSDIESQPDEETFRTLYRLKVNSPFNYALPRRFRLGLAMKF